MQENIVLTREMIHAAQKGPGGGWSKQRLKMLGVQFPLTKGWLSSLVGKPITLDQYRAFIGRADWVPGAPAEQPADNLSGNPVVQRIRAKRAAGLL